MREEHFLAGEENRPTGEVCARCACGYRVIADTWAFADWVIDKHIETRGFRVAWRVS